MAKLLKVTGCHCSLVLSWQLSRVYSASCLIQLDWHTQQDKNRIQILHIFM